MNTSTRTKKILLSLIGFAIFAILSILVVAVAQEDTGLAERIIDGCVWALPALMSAFFLVNRFILDDTRNRAKISEWVRYFSSDSPRIDKESIREILSQFASVHNEWIASKKADDDLAFQRTSEYFIKMCSVFLELIRDDQVHIALTNAREELAALQNIDDATKETDVDERLEVFVVQQGYLSSSMIRLEDTFFSLLDSILKEITEEADSVKNLMPAVIADTEHLSTGEELIHLLATVFHETQKAHAISP